MAWVVEALPEVARWLWELHERERKAAQSVDAAVQVLEQHGPTLGRPLVDRIKGSRVHSLKELRPSGMSIRGLFVFDPERKAILLVAGDKAGDWNGWYRKNIPLAETRYERYLSRSRGAT